MPWNCILEICFESFFFYGYVQGNNSEIKMQVFSGKKKKLFVNFIQLQENYDFITSDVSS